MRRRFWWYVLVTGMVCTGGTQATELVKVTADRVNLRARPSLKAEVLGQVEAGDILIARGMDEAWVEIIPEDHLKFWIHGDFISEGAVTATKLNVRAGPGINYSTIGVLARDDQVKVIEQSGEWLGIEPPVGSSLWVSRSLVERMETEPSSVAATSEREPTRNPPVLPTGPGTRVPVQPAPPTGARGAVEPKPVPPKDLVLIPLEGQGRRVQKEGILKRVGFVLGRPSGFRLVGTPTGRSQTLCYVRGNTQQLEAFLGRRMTIRGPQYWVQGVRHAVVIPEQIVPHAGP